MRFIFEHQKPFLRLSVDVDGDLDRTGIDLLGNVKSLERSRMYKIFRAYGREIHKGNRLFLPSQFTAELEISLISIFRFFVQDLRSRR